VSLAVKRHDTEHLMMRCYGIVVSLISGGRNLIICVSPKGLSFSLNEGEQELVRDEMFNVYAEEL